MLEEGRVIVAVDNVVPGLNREAELEQPLELDHLLGGSPADNVNDLNELLALKVEVFGDEGAVVLLDSLEVVRQTDLSFFYFLFYDLACHLEQVSEELSVRCILELLNAGLPRTLQLLAVELVHLQFILVAAKGPYNQREDIVHGALVVELPIDQLEQFARLGQRLTLQDILHRVAFSLVEHFLQDEVKLVVFQDGHSQRDENVEGLDLVEPFFGLLLHEKDESLVIEAQVVDSLGRKVSEVYRLITVSEVSVYPLVYMHLQRRHLLLKVHSFSVLESEIFYRRLHSLERKQVIQTVLRRLPIEMYDCDVGLELALGGEDSVPLVPADLVLAEVVSEVEVLFEGEIVLVVVSGLELRRTEVAALVLLLEVDHYLLFVVKTLLAKLVSLVLCNRGGTPKVLAQAFPRTLCARRARSRCRLAALEE